MKKSVSGEAPAEAPAARSFRISTEHFPERDREAIVREVLGPKTFGYEIEPLDDRPFRGNFCVRSLPGLDIASNSHSPVRIGRTRELLGSDYISFAVSSEPCTAVQFGRELSNPAGAGCAMSEGEVGSATFPSACEQLGLRLPRNALGPLLRDSDGCFMRPVSQNDPALQLLMHYLDYLKNEAATPTLEIQRLAVTHVYDLLALALGATRDAAEFCRGRGVRAAHLHAIKKDVTASLGGRISIGNVAARHGLTPRYVQMLFEDESTTFTEFVREQRLVRAHGMLISRRFDHLRITDIAFDVGFDDLSYFNRMFARRFGLTPRDVRELEPIKSRAKPEP